MLAPPRRPGVIRAAYQTPSDMISRAVAFMLDLGGGTLVGLPAPAPWRSQSAAATAIAPATAPDDHPVNDDLDAMRRDAEIDLLREALVERATARTRALAEEAQTRAAAAEAQTRAAAAEARTRVAAAEAQTRAAAAEAQTRAAAAEAQTRAATAEAQTRAAAAEARARAAAGEAQTRVAAAEARTRAAAAETQTRAAAADAQLHSERERGEALQARAEALEAQAQELHGAIAGLAELLEQEGVHASVLAEVVGAETERREQSESLAQTLQAHVARLETRLEQLVDELAFAAAAREDAEHTAAELLAQAARADWRWR